jgi:uncharacterized protein
MMTRPEDSAWAIPVGQLGSRAGQTKRIDAVFPAPSGIGDAIIGVREGDDVRIEGDIDSIVDGLILSASISAPVHAQCTRCLIDIHRPWNVPVTTFFPYDPSAGAYDAPRGHAGSAEVEIIAGEDESEDEYPLSPDGAFADVEALIRDALVEALPLQPLCREECRGLCPQCGINLNEHPDHHHETGDIRFAALEDFKRQLERGTAR